MEGDLLRREQEFHKLNSELEERTSRIFQEIAAKNRSTVVPESCQKDQRSHVIRSRSFSLRNEPGANTKEEKGAAGAGSVLKSDKLDDPLALRSNGLGYEATNRLLRAKLTILNKEVDTLRQEYKTKTEECRRTAVDLSHCDEERARLENTLMSTRETAAALQAKLDTTALNLTKAHAENGALTKELASLKKDLKQQKQQTSTFELRLNRALEDAEKLRANAKQIQLQHKDERERQRGVVEQLQTKLKGFERQRTELMSICTKQSHLVDNLRRQKSHLEATRFLHAAEQEFDNMLDWCLKSEGETASAEKPI